MLIVILIIGLIILAAGITLYSLSAYSTNNIVGRWAYRHEGVYCALNVIGVVISVITLIAIMTVGYTCSEEKAISAKIEMYQQENQHIETIVAGAIKSYQDYEKQIFTELSPKEIMVAVSLYPELKSNELILEQLKIYTSNNNEIKQLKAKKIDMITAKWWLYFGN